MESVIIVAPHSYDAQLKQRLAQRWTVTNTVAGGWAIGERETRVYVYRNDALAEDMEPDAHARILALTPDPVFYVVDFNDIELCRKVLFAIADDSKLLIDNDHGELLMGPDFLRRLQDQPHWDWRSDGVVTP